MRANAFPDGSQGERATALTSMMKQRRGQATLETVLLLPLFMLFLFLFVKIFAMLVLVQKVELASFYAARRWQLESHRNVMYEQSADVALQNDIRERMRDYLGLRNPAGGVVDLMSVDLDISRTQVWQVVTLTVKTRPFKIPFTDSQKAGGFKFETTKYVPNRDRPIAFELPGLKG